MTDMTRIERIVRQLPGITVLHPYYTLSGEWLVVIPGKQTRGFGDGDVMADELETWT
jgi:hypothetical protein